VLEAQLLKTSGANFFSDFAELSLEHGGFLGKRREEPFEQVPDGGDELARDGESGEASSFAIGQRQSPAM